MESIIKKAIEGGYTVNGLPLRWNEKTKSWWYYWMSEDEDGNPIELENPACLDHPHGMYPMIPDPLFWQSLGKACGWEGEQYFATLDTNAYTDSNIIDGDWNYLSRLKNHEIYALRFHEINLTEGWDEAVKWLEDLIK